MVIVNVAVVCPAGTITPTVPPVRVGRPIVEGDAADVRRTVCPPAGAAEARVTVAWADVLPNTVDGTIVSDCTATPLVVGICTMPCRFSVKGFAGLLLPRLNVPPNVPSVPDSKPIVVVMLWPASRIGGSEVVRPNRFELILAEVSANWHCVCT